MRIRILSLLLLLCLCAGLLAGCGKKAEVNPPEPSNSNAPFSPSPSPVTPSTDLASPPDEAQILYDINNFGLDVLVQNGAEATSCELIKRQSNTEKKEDLTYVRVLCETGYSRLEYQFELIYNFYDVGGWILDEAYPYKQEEWTEVFLDAEGNNILDSIIWIDNLEVDDFLQQPSGFWNGQYFCEVNGTHYFGVPAQNTRSSGDFWPFDDSGRRLTGNYIEDMHRSSVSKLFTNSSGQVRMICHDSFENGVLSDEGDVLDFIADENYNMLSEPYSYIYTPANGLEDICIVRDKKNNLYGAIDTDGSIVLEPKFETYAEAYKAMGVTVETVKVAEPDEVITVYFNSEGNGAVLDENMQPVFTQPYTECRRFLSQKLIALYSDDVHFRLYDIRGRVRSPEFWAIGKNGGNFELIAYNGRVGILPTIVGPAERVGYNIEYYTGGEIAAAE